MSLTTALSVVAVSDLDEAKEFYTNLFGRGPDLEPMPTLAQWDIENGGGVQVVEQPESSESSMVTLLVDGFDDFLQELHEKGVEHGEVALAEVTDATALLTTDPRLARTPGPRCTIQLL